MRGRSGAWHPVGIDSAVERGPSERPVVPHRGSLDLLPLELLSWPDFESLQWRILRDVEGLRHAQIYGTPGQVQRGLDLIALAADDSGVALQSKRVKQFGPAGITAAVNAFRKASRPFDVSRFIIGVSREVRTTRALDRFRALQAELKPVELELWDKRELSMKLKGAPRIVIEYFGEDVARLFCEPFVVGTAYVPAGDAVAVREAIARTPEITTGAGSMIAEAKDRACNDSAAALALVEEAQSALTAAGFAGHAAQHESLRSSLLVAMGRGSEATRRRLDQLWVALDQGQAAHASSARRDIHSLTAGDDPRVDREVSQQHMAVADAAIDLYENPLAYVPDLDKLLLGDVADRAQLAALAGEIALADGNHDWLAKHAGTLERLSNELDDNSEHHALRVRLRILAAEASGEWAPVLADARSLKIGYALGALVQARHARYLALEQHFERADAGWDEAAGSACLAERWTDAARWTFSRRAFRARWNPFASDALLPIQTALLARGPDVTVLARDEDALEYAYNELAENRLRSAAIAAQRALRDAVTLSDWEGERRARCVLADVLSASGEPNEAAHHLVRASSIDRLKRLGQEQTKRFLDVTTHLTATAYWVAGAAYRLLAVQGDLIPDDLVNLIADAALSELAAAEKGNLVDLPGFAGSRYLGAMAALASIASRLNAKCADQLLTYFESQTPVEPNHYRYHDADEALATAEIAATHPQLIDRALAHLIALLNRSAISRKARTVEVVTDNIGKARACLEAFAEQGSAWATEVLTTENPERATDDEVQRAKARLETPLEINPGVVTVGSGTTSLTDSILVRTLSPYRQEGAFKQLIERAANAHVSAPDRASYLLAASNLTPPTAKTRRQALLNSVIELVVSPPDYAADAADAMFRHPLGGFRVVGGTDARAEAAYLAAGLARTREEKNRVRTATLGLVGDDTVSEYWMTRALQRLGDTMTPDVGFLSGLDWALKSLAAILWAKTTKPTPVGYRLADDSDVRVRRALALAVAETHPEFEPPSRSRALRKPALTRCEPNAREYCGYCRTTRATAFVGPQGAAPISVMNPAPARRRPPGASAAACSDACATAAAPVPPDVMPLGEERLHRAAQLPCAL